ncbi:hypothetical protein AX15_000396 [Amanita polypyramis BW_CC]|nr:hypothetical protein AX15_000396 [Amanita polypyramis BW_CC]
MQFFAKEIHLDQYGKATNFRLHSMGKPHMRAFHMAWISFMVAFFAWYSIPPLISYIASDLKVSSKDVYDSNVVAVTATIVARFVVGPLCERFGPRRVMATILIVGSIPCAMTGLLRSAGGLIGLRLVIGILGAAFIPCQFWATQMFSPSVIGTANAITAGWGNMGAGITYLLMPAIFGGIRSHLPLSKAWRVVFVIPAAACILVAICDLLFATDTPHGDWFRKEEDIEENIPPKELGKPSVEPDFSDTKAAGALKDDAIYKDGGVTTKVIAADDESIHDVRRNESVLSAFLGFFKMLVRPPVLIMVCVYACSFGIELAIDNVIGLVYEKNFHLNPSRAAYIGSIFGLLNICSRLSGGLFSDFMAHRFRLPGRILALLIGMLFEGAFLIGFSFGLTSLKTSILLMVFFSIFVQAVCGLTFGIVPFIDPSNNGKVMGIVGAGGNLGGLIFNLMFRGFGPRYPGAFLCLGCVCLGVSVIGCALLRVQNKTVWSLLR